MEKPNGKIAYIHIQFPKLSETFVWREVEALKAIGIDIVNYSFKRPFPGEICVENCSFVNDTLYLPHYLSFDAIKSHVYWFFRKPFTYLSTLFHIFASHYPPGNFWLAWRKPILFWRAVHLASLIIRDKNIVHLHAHFKYVALIAWIVSRFTDHPYSFTAHFATNALMAGRVAEDAKFVVAVSDWEHDRVIQKMRNTAAAPIHVIRLGLPDDYFEKIDESKKSEIPTIISVGRLIPKKGFVNLLRALAKLQDRKIKFNAIIVGDGPLREKLEAFKSSLGLDECAMFVGSQTPGELRKYIDSSNIFALFCTYGPDGDVDGLPVAMMEAMSRGLPVVTTKISSLRELVDDGVNGYTVQPGNIAEFADALEKLIVNSSMRREMGIRAREKIKLEYTLEREAREMKKLFDSVL